MNQRTHLPDHVELMNRAIREHFAKTGTWATPVSAEQIWHQCGGLELELVVRLSDGHSFSVRAPYPEPAKILRELGEPVH
jgi:hypothetical protein